MANMSLGTYTFEVNPSEIPGLIDADRFGSYVETYTSVKYYDWGSRTVGKEVNLKWDYMPITMYNNLRTLYAADSSYTWTPGQTDGKTYTVRILPGFPGDSAEYHLSLTDTMYSASSYRKNVEMKLLILADL